MSFPTPIIITNFKAYRESTGANAVELAKVHERLSKELGVNLAVAGQAMDLALLAASVSIPVFAQHVDGGGFGPYTGSVPVEIAHGLGVDGAMLNHSEQRISDTQIQRALEDLKEMNMCSLVCAEDVKEGVKFAEMGADFVAIEPPELIGGNISVSTAKPEVISQAVEAIGPGRVIVGAGIKSAEDVRIALELGAVGILVASGVVCAEDSIEALRGLASGLEAS